MSVNTTFHQELPLLPFNSHFSRWTWVSCFLLGFSSHLFRDGTSGINGMGIFMRWSVAWPCPCFVHHRTPNRRGIAPLMQVVWQQYLKTFPQETEGNLQVNFQVSLTLEVHETIYTVFHKIRTPLYFGNNFFKCWSIWMKITSVYSLGNLFSWDVVCSCSFINVLCIA